MARAARQVPGGPRAASAAAPAGSAGPGRAGKQRAREAKQELYRRLVLEAAERVFAENGYEDARMEEIARESGIALGTLYSVCSGKAELYAAIHETADREILEVTAEAVRGLDEPVEALLAGIRSYARYFLSRPDLLRMHLKEGFAWGTEQGAGAGNDGRTDAWKQGVERVAQDIRRCIEAGAFIDGDARLYARMMIATQQIQLAHWIETGMKGSPDDVLVDITEHVLRAFGRPGKPTGA